MMNSWWVMFFFSHKFEVGNSVKLNLEKKETVKNTQNPTAKRNVQIHLERINYYEMRQFMPTRNI